MPCSWERNATDAHDAALDEARSLAAGLYERNPGDREDRDTYTSVLFNVAVSVEGDSAISQMRQVIGLYESLASDFPDYPAYHRWLALASGWLAIQLAPATDSTEADQAHERAAQLFEELLRRDPDNWDYLQRYCQIEQDIGNKLAAAGRFEEALAPLRRGAALGQQIVSRTVNPSQDFSHLTFTLI